MSYGAALIQGERSFRGCFRDWVSLQRSDIGVRKVDPDSGQAGPSAAKFRVVIKRLLKTPQSLAQSFLGALVRKIKSLKVEVVCVGIALNCANGRRICKLYFKRINDGLCDLVLKLEHIAHFALN